MEIKQISDKEYFAIQAFSNSASKYLLRSPKHFKANDFNGSTATRVGTAVHARMLNERWDEEIIVYNGTKTLTSKSALEFVAANPGMTVITQEESDKAKQLVDSQDPRFLSFFQKTKNEMAIVGEIDGVPVKCKMDAYSEEMKILYDVKTTMDLDKFKRNFYELGYHRQAAWYLKLADLAGIKADHFMFYVVESSAPFCSKFVSCSPEVIADGKEEIEKAFDIYKQCYKTNDWSDGYDDDVFQITRPNWRRKKKTGGDEWGSR